MTDRIQGESICDRPLERFLLTPGPLTTRTEIRRAMAKDWGSRDPEFLAATLELRSRLLAIARGQGSHVAIPMQGGGTFVVEAAIGTLVRSTDKLLVLANGVYGERIIEIARRIDRPVDVLRFEVNQPVEPHKVSQRLTQDKAITHVALVHCETASGLLNPLEAIAATVADHRRHLILDAMSTFGALPVDVSTTPITAVLASSGKCLEGTPGIGFAIVDRSIISTAHRNSSSLCLDLRDQWQSFEASGQWRFTPPVQVVAAAVEALRLLENEGGPSKRLERYKENFATLCPGMQKIGFRAFLPENVQAPVICAFHYPEEQFSFESFYRALAARGFLIYPGKIEGTKTLRVGCIGAIDRRNIESFLIAARQSLRDSTDRSRGLLDM